MCIRDSSYCGESKIDLNFSVFTNFNPIIFYVYYSYTLIIFYYKEELSGQLRIKAKRILRMRNPYKYVITSHMVLREISKVRFKFNKGKLTKFIQSIFLFNRKINRLTENSPVSFTPTKFNNKPTVPQKITKM